MNIEANTTETTEIVKKEKDTIFYFADIEKLFEKYQENSYMFQRLCYHLTNILPTALDNEDKNHMKRILRNTFLTGEQQNFIQIFLSKNQYYYLQNNNCFYHYYNKTYGAIKEDDIHHQLLSTISKDRTLMQWKHKTKINIIKQIKDRNLFKSIPETDTIQSIIHFLYPSIFSNKHQVTYFLTIIGDNILKKHNDLIFFTKPKTKKLLSELDNISYITTGISNITQNFVTKYHENFVFHNCRLLNINNTIQINTWKDNLQKIGLDLLCVAAHYSDRYHNSEQYMNNNMNEELVDYTLYLKNNTHAEIVSKFCEYAIENVPVPNNNKFSIKWKNMHFIWKIFISKFSLPNMIYTNTLKNLLKSSYTYDEETDSFYNITSKYLPIIGDFICFWDKTITVGSSSSSQMAIDYELEIDEICNLFKIWVKENSNDCYSNGNIDENNVIKILNHYYPNIEIIDNKFALNVQCCLWNKLNDIESMLESLKNHYKNKAVDDELMIPFDTVYDYYLKNNDKNYFTISKCYIEKYICATLSEFIEFDKFISSSWYYI